MNYLQTYQQAHGLTPDGVIGKQTAKVMMEDLGITSIVEFCHFIAQVEHESGHFTAGRENLNYSANGLVATFGKYFSPGEVASYARHPEKIANRVYANRMGNGDEASGDGWRNRGVGALQLTGADNIQQFLKSENLPLDTNPEVLIQPDFYFKTAKYFFDVNQVWKNCQGGADLNIIKVSKHINLGNADSIRKPNGLAERITLTKKYLHALT
jgi:putative chitinase